MPHDDHLEETLPPDREDQDTMDTLDTSMAGESAVPSTPSHPFTPGQESGTVPKQIGPYTITGIIGSGGMGTVYEATQEQPRRRVALKVVKAGQVSELAKRRFNFEVQTLAKLQHRGIAGVYEAGIYTGGGHEQPYFAMEYIPGARSLTDYAKDEDLDLKTRLELFMQICDAIHHGHQKGIIHRDLKPENILVDRDGNPKIIDFGIARATDADIAVTTMQTSVGQILGTLQYMSPEQCLGDPDLIDTRADVYSLGVIFYELLCDELPYDVSKQALVEAVRIIREEKPSRPSTITKVVRGDLETISMKALEKTSARRYDSAASFKRDIERYLNHEPIDARPPSLVYQVSMFTRRHRLTAVAASVTILAIIGGLIATSIAWVHAAEQTRIAIEQRAEAESQRLLAEAKTREVEQKVKDIQTIADFQSEQLSSIDVPSMSSVMRERMKESMNLDDPDLSGVDFIGTALAMLDEFIFAEAIAKANQGLQDQPLVLAKLLNTIGNTYESLGMLQKSFAPIKQAMDLRIAEHGRDHPDSIESIINYGLVLKSLGRYEESIVFLQEGLTRHSRIVGENDAACIKLMSHIGCTQESLGLWEEAGISLREAVARGRRHLGADHLTTLFVVSNLTIFLRDGSKPEEALLLARDTLERIQRIKGECRETYSEMGLLASILGILDRSEEAKAYYEQILDYCLTHLGQNHPMTDTTYNDLGGVYYVDGDYENAALYFKRSLQISERTHGSTHFKTLTSRSNYAMALSSLGEPAEALKELLPVRDTRLRNLGPDHQDTLITLFNIAKVKANMGDVDEALAIHIQVLDVRRRLWTTYHPVTLESLYRVSSMHHRMDNFAEAEKYYLETIDAQRALLEEGHPDLLTNLENLGILWYQLGRHDESIDHLSEVLQTRRSVRGEDDFATIRAIRRIARYEKLQERYDSALISYKETLEKSSRVLGVEHDYVRDSLEKIIEIYGVMHDSQPDSGHDVTAADYREQLAQLAVVEVP